MIAEPFALGSAQDIARLVAVLLVNEGAAGLAGTLAASAGLEDSDHSPVP